MNNRTVPPHGVEPATRAVLPGAAAAPPGPPACPGADPHRVTGGPAVSGGAAGRLGRVLARVRDRVRSRRDEEPLRDDLLRAGQEPRRPRTSMVALINGGRGRR